MRTRILFLDFDGVCVTWSDIRKKRRPATADQGCISNLNRIVRETGAKIVVTSSWRISNSADALWKVLFDWGFRGEVLDATPHIDSKRALEVCSWLMLFNLETKERPNFVILDDEDHDLWMLGDRVVKCDPMKGLTNYDADRAISLFAV